MNITSEKIVGPHSHWDPANQKTITIKRETWTRLRKYGTYGDSFDSILQRILSEKAERERQGKETPEDNRSF